MSVSRNLLFALSGLLCSCQEGADAIVSAEKVAAEKKYFVSAASGDHTTRSTLQFLASTFGQEQLSSLLKYDVQAYAVTYHTTFQGDVLRASGLMLVPKDMAGPAPIISLQHGTTFLKSEAPSLNSGFQGMEFFASAGYITLIPDYIGYGESDSVFHPYYDRQHAASAVIDLIKAAKEFLAEEEILFNEQLFLAGYSEGGFATLAAAKEIEQQPQHNLKLTAVAAGAGGYDLVAMHQDVAASQYYAYPGYLAFVIKAYNETYSWNKPLSYFFGGKYADAVSRYLNGEYSGHQINSKLTTHVPSLLNASFFRGLQSEQGEPEFKQALAANSVAGWKTDVPIRLFHGTKDEIIPYRNSEITLRNFKAAGSKDVTLTPIPGGTHGNTFEPMLRNFIPWFLGF